MQCKASFEFKRRTEWMYALLDIVAPIEIQEESLLLVDQQP
jgi:hypothetical protein